jgi:N-acetylneuraminic acid mutarotase
MKKSTASSGFFSPRALIAFLVSATTCSIVMGTLSRTETPAKTANRTLTFEERASYQRAIEDVYWRHRIWPKDRPDPKPSLDAVMSQAQLEKKVTDYLRKSQALEDYWKHPITAKQLQAEMDRMAQHTRQPEVLQELFDALGNDPFVIAECLVRPALAERSVTSRYSHDQRIHGELKQRAEAELKAQPSVERMKQLSGKYSEIELVKSDSGESVARAVAAATLPNKLAGGASTVQRQDSTHSVKLNSREWNETVEKLVTAFNKDRTSVINGRDGLPGRSSKSARPAVAPYQTIPIGKLSPLQEDESHYYATAVINKANDRLKLTTVSWPKEPLELWLAKAEPQEAISIAAACCNYTLPKISGGGCVEDTWTATAAPPEPREGHAAVWTGAEMIIWGGANSNFGDLNTGGRYNPGTDTWIPTSTTNAPSARDGHTAVWTGSEMIVWGGYDGAYVNTGARYNPDTDSWAATSTSSAPDGRNAHTGVWSGTEMIVWGGWDGNTLFNTGGRYNSNTDSWTATSTINVPEGRFGHTAALTGNEMIIWGGTGEFNLLNTGGRYNPTSDSWVATSTNNAPDARDGHTAISTGAAMIVWGGGDDFGDPLNTGGSYDPTSDSWTATDITNAPDPRTSHTAVWTGVEMIVWGGYDGFGIDFFNTGGRYSPGTNSWTATTTINAPDPRAFHTAVWSGNEMIVWGGVVDFFTNFDTGGRYDPSTDSWANTGTIPSPRENHTAVWTGDEMIVWGGQDRNSVPFSLPLNSGGIYVPTTDSWIAPNIIDAPSARLLHTAVWTGTEMIVWGGTDFFGTDFNTGGRYNPVADSWTATSTTNAPSARDSHTAVWTGGDMIVWGGENQDFVLLNTGGRYNPSTSSWVATGTGNAPSARGSHTAVWTGSQMIVWGGFDGNDFVNSGGRYDPTTNSWTPTSTTNAPTGRDYHTAVWTGSEMIIWGGFGVTNNVNTGGRYTPSTNSWTATGTTNAPDGRAIHTAVWTGSEMIIWGGSGDFGLFNTGGRYNPGTDSWIATSTSNAPSARDSHTAIWSGNEMIVWGGLDEFFNDLDSGGRYCVQSRPTPTPTPSITPTPTPTVSPTATPTPTATPRVTPRPRPTPHTRPTPP